MITIVDYDTGNIKNLQRALQAVGIDSKVTDQKNELLAANGIILPGVGAFSTAMNELKQRNLIEPLQTAAKNQIPILGICLGMQLLFDESFEFGQTQGLGLINGSIVKIPETNSLTVPQTGWNQNQLCQNDPIGEIFANQYTYFVHSFYAKTNPENIITEVDYGIKIPGMVKKNNVIGFQFHPEKSGEIGLRGLKKFKELTENANYSRN